jgi:hypothetical protein
MPTISSMNVVSVKYKIPEWEPAQDSSDGYPIRDWAPLFCRSSRTATVINHARDRDRRASTAANGSRKRSIDSGVPFGTGTGLFLGRSGSGMERANAAGSSQLGEFSKREPTPEISRAELIQHRRRFGRGSRHVVPHLATQPRYLYQC